MDTLKWPKNENPIFHNHLTQSCLLLSSWFESFTWDHFDGSVALPPVLTRLGKLPIQHKVTIVCHYWTLYKTQIQSGSIQKEQKKKQEAHGPHRSPEKPVQIREVMIIYTLYYKTGPVVQEEKIFKSPESTFTIFCYLPIPFHLNKLKSSSPKDTFC